MAECSCAEYADCPRGPEPPLRSRQCTPQRVDHGLLLGIGHCRVERQRYSFGIIAVGLGTFPALRARAVVGLPRNRYVMKIYTHAGGAQSFKHLTMGAT